MAPPLLLQRVAAYALLRDDDDRILLVRAGAASNVPGMWFLPGGGVEHGEHPEDALIREVEEETGYVCLPLDLVRVHSSVTDLPGRTERVHTIGLVYRAEIRGGALRDELGGSSEEATWLGVDKALGLPLAPFVGELLALG